MSALTRQPPAVLIAAAFIIALAAARSLDVLAVIALHVTLNLACGVALVLIGAHLSGGARRRKKAQRWMLTHARNALTSARPRRPSTPRP